MTHPDEETAFAGARLPLPAPPREDSPMPRYEFSDDKSNKFWEIQLEGKSVTTHWGRIGTDGQTKSKGYGSDDEAKKEYDKAIASKVKKGYELVGDGASGSSAAVATGARNPELEATIVASPDEADGYLVYGDWLQSQGEPIGELVGIQHALAKDPDDAELLAAEEKLLKGNANYFFGPEQPAADSNAPERGQLASYRRPKSWPETGWKYGHTLSQWENGFIRNLFFDTGYYGDDERVSEDAGKILAAVLAQPSARFVREFALGEVWMQEDYEGPDQGVAIDAIAAAPCAKTIRVIEVFGGDHDISGVSLDASNLWKACPNLEEVTLFAGQLTVGNIDFPNGRKFAAQTGGLDKSDLECMTEANWPNLEDLEIWFGAEEYGANCDVEGLGPILRGEGLLKLKRLALKNSEFGDDICKALASAPITKQLEELDLTMGIIGDDGARALVGAKERLANLKTLSIAGYFSDDVATALKGLAPTVAVDVRGEPDEEYRYVECGE